MIKAVDAIQTVDRKNLKLQFLAIHVNSTNFEVNPDSRDKTRREGIIWKSQQQTTLAYTCGSESQKIQKKSRAWNTAMIPESPISSNLIKWS